MPSKMITGSKQDHIKPVGMRCGHTLLFNFPYPTENQYVWCLKCDAPTLVA